MRATALYLAGNHPWAVAMSTVPPVQRSRARLTRTTARRLLTAAAAALVVVEAVLGRHRLAGVLSYLGRADAWWVAAAVAATLLSMHGFARAQRRMLAAGGVRVPMGRMIRMVYAANAINWTLPAGTALSAGYVVRRLRSWGATGAAATFTVLASGVLSSLSFAALCVAAGASLGSVASIAVGVAAGACALAVLLVTLHRPAAAAGAVGHAWRVVARLAHRDGTAGDVAIRRFVADLGAVLPRRRDWLFGFGWAALNWCADLACLFAACHAVGLDSPALLGLAAAYATGMVASSASLVPGGFGVVDVAMIAALAAGGTPTVAATSAVLLYRLISCVLVVGAGWLILLVSRVRAPNA